MNRRAFLGTAGAAAVAPYLQVPSILANTPREEMSLEVSGGHLCEAIAIALSAAAVYLASSVAGEEGGGPVFTALEYGVRTQ